MAQWNGPKNREFKTWQIRTEIKMRLSLDDEYRVVAVRGTASTPRCSSVSVKPVGRCV